MEYQYNDNDDVLVEQQFLEQLKQDENVQMMRNVEAQQQQRRPELRTQNRDFNNNNSGQEILSRNRSKTVDVLQNPYVYRENEEVGLQCSVVALLEG